MLLAFCGVLLTFIAGRLSEEAKREQSARNQQVEAAKRYRIWYDTLSPYQRIQEDNRRLQQENERLSDIVGSQDR